MVTLRAGASEHDRLGDLPDPSDWAEVRGLAHRLLDEAMDRLRTARERPPRTGAGPSLEPLPVRSQPIAKACASARRLIAPGAGGREPTSSGLLAALLATAMGGNRDHSAAPIERQVIDWCRRLFALPDGATGSLVDGAETATRIGLGLARDHRAGADVVTDGLAAAPAPLVGYASIEAPASVPLAFEALGLGRAALRRIGVDGEHRIDLDGLRRAIARDLAEGLRPFCVIGTAGTLATGAIDDLQALALLCAEHRLWLHVEAGEGGPVALSEVLKARLAGIERADSLAFDFLRWPHVAADAGCILVRQGDRRRVPAADGTRALELWLALKEHGTRRLGAAVERTRGQARYVAARVRNHIQLELMAPVALNVVCFRFVAPGLDSAGLDRLNAEIVGELGDGRATPPAATDTPVGQTVIRLCLSDHPTRQTDLDQLLDQVVAIGGRRVAPGPDGFPAGQAFRPPEAPTLCGRMREPERRAIVAASRRAELGALCAGVSFRVATDLDVPFRITRTFELVLRAASLGHPAAATLVIRHAIELALWQRLSGASSEESRAAIDLLAARVAGLYFRAMAPDERSACATALPEWLLAAYEMAASAAPTAPDRWHEDAPRLVLEQLGRLRDGGAREPGGNWTALGGRFGELRDLAVPSEHLLAAGGGSADRSRPQPTLLAFGPSSTSSVSPQAFAEVERFRQELISTALGDDLGATLDRSIAATKRQILEACGVADMAGIEIALLPSGAAGAVAAWHLARQEPGRRLVVIVSEETALSGAPIAGLDPDLIDLRVVPMRDPAGAPWPIAEVDAEVAALVEDAVAAGSRCLVHRLDGSTTGLQGPSLEAIDRLREQHVGQVDVLVDTGQAHLAPDRLRASLDAGFMVWLSGPPFAAALLVPAGRTGPLPQEVNLHLLLRCRAGLWEMRAHRAVPPEQRRRIVAELGAAIAAAIEAAPGLRPVPVAEIDGEPQTIFPFTIRPAGGHRGAMDLAAAARVQRQLERDLSPCLPPEAPYSAQQIAAVPCRAAEPVEIGAGAALSLCIGTHLVAATAFDGALGPTLDARLATQIERARLVVRKIELIVRHDHDPGVADPPLAEIKSA